MVSERLLPPRETKRAERAAGPGSAVLDRPDDRAVSVPRWRVLVVDDEPAIRTVLRGLLECEGYLVETAEDASAGLALLGQQNFDAVVLDRLLPDTDGLEFCRTARLQPRDTYLPILMLTALSLQSQMVKGLDAGADDYVAKPYRDNELLARLRRLLRRHARPA